MASVVNQLKNGCRSMTFRIKQLKTGYRSMALNVKQLENDC